MLGKSGIYCIANEIDGKLYVGSASKFKKRFSAHRNLLKKGSHSNIRLQRAHDRDGIESFSFNVIEVVEKENLIEREQFWIDFFSAYKLGYNFLPIAGSRAGSKATEETRNKMCSARKRRGSPFAGFKHTDEAKKKMSVTRTGRKKSPESVEKTAMAHRGMKRSDEAKLKMSLAWVRRRAEMKDKTPVNQAYQR